MKLRVLLFSLSCCLALTACGGEDNSVSSTEPVATEESAKAPAPVDEASSDSSLGFPMSGEEHTPEGEPHDAPPLPPGAGK